MSGQALSLTLPPLRAEISEAAALLRISRALLYKRIQAGDIHVQKDGSRSYITAVELQRYVATLEKSAA